MARTADVSPRAGGDDWPRVARTQYAEPARLTFELAVENGDLLSADQVCVLQTASGEPLTLLIASVVSAHRVVCRRMAGGGDGSGARDTLSAGTPFVFQRTCTDAERVAPALSPLAIPACTPLGGPHPTDHHRATDLEPTVAHRPRVDRGRGAHADFVGLSTLIEAGMTLPLALTPYNRIEGEVRQLPGNAFTPPIYSLEAPAGTRVRVLRTRVVAWTDVETLAAFSVTATFGTFIGGKRRGPLHSLRFPSQTEALAAGAPTNPLALFALVARRLPECRTRAIVMRPERPYVTTLPHGHAGYLSVQILAIQPSVPAGDFDIMVDLLATVELRYVRRSRRPRTVGAAASACSTLAT
jgi:hypothetical protein